MPKRHDDNPPTVGFNLKEMREKATQALLEASRLWAEEIRKIDILEEMFNTQHAATVNQVNTRAGSAETRSNGHAAPELKRRQTHAKLTLAERQAINDAITAELANHPGVGRTISQLHETLMARGEMPPNVSTQTDAAQNFIRYRLNAMLADKQISSRVGVSPLNGWQPVTFYLPAKKQKRTYSPEGLKGARAGAAKARAAKLAKLAKDKQTM